MLVEICSLLLQESTSEINSILDDAVSPSWAYETRTIRHDIVPRKGLGFKGLSRVAVDSMLSSIVSTRGPNVGLTIVLTAIQLDSVSRIIIDIPQKCIVISLWRLSQFDPSRRSAALVYAATAAFRQGVGNPHEGDFNSDCVYAAGKYDKSVRIALCPHCRSKLRDLSGVVAQELGHIASASERPQHIVFLQHGIRTGAPWYDDIRRSLIKFHLTPIPYWYGYFSIPKFILNPIFGRRIKEVFVREYRMMRKANPNCRISVIAHSYGTLALAEALRDHQDIYVHKIVFVNSIVPRDFEWASLADRSQFRQLLNECGGKDIWPVMAKKLIWGAGSSGSHGFAFDTDRVLNTFYRNAGHSDLLNADQCSKVWAPFLIDGPGHNKPESERKSIGFWPKLLGISLFYQFAIIFILYKLATLAMERLF